MRGEVSGLTTWLTPHERDRPSTASLVRPSTAQQRSVDFYGRLNPDPAAATPRHVRQPTFNDSLVDFSMTQQTPFASTFTGPSVTFLAMTQYPDISRIWTGTAPNET